MRNRWKDEEKWGENSSWKVFCLGREKITGEEKIPADPILMIKFPCWDRCEERTLKKKKEDEGEEEEEEDR